MTTERCERCDDTHVMSMERGDMPCTACPVPCQQCRAGGTGAYCETTPCACSCHGEAAEEIDWRTRARDAEALLTALADEFDKAARDKLDRGGMRVPYQGDFSGCTITTAIRMRWWAARIREAIGTVLP